MEPLAFHEELPPREQGMPNTLVLVRHGESEANVMQGLAKNELWHPDMHEIYSRPDWQQRLSPRGVEQARQAGRWIEQNLGSIATFDLRLMSYFLRARETSAYLTNPDLQPSDIDLTNDYNHEGWQVNDSLIERNWGVYGTLTLAEQKALYPRMFDLKKSDPLHVTLDGGEGHINVRLRVRDLLGTLVRESAGKRVIATCHGDLMTTARMVMERQLPEEWMAMDEDQRQRTRNCSLLEYSRINPKDPSEVGKHARWMRFIYTDAPEESPFGGEWKEIPYKRRFKPEQILAQLALSPPVISDIDTFNSQIRPASDLMPKPNPAYRPKRLRA